MLGCKEEVESLACQTKATVKFQTGTNGCEGFVFMLADGTVLVPILDFCRTPDLNQDASKSAIEGFYFSDGKEVKIDYSITPHMSECLGGSIANITCISEQDTSNL
jgi:hypothetical protein